MKVLVTGGTGQLGRSIQHSVNKLSDNKNSYLFINSSQVNLTNLIEVQNLLRNFTPDIIIHTAAKVGGIIENLNNSHIISQENLLIDLNLIKSSVDLGISKILLMGSSCAYPIDANKPLKEISLFEGKVEETNRSYALSKLITLDLAMNLNKKFGLNFKTIILSNLYGPFDLYNKEKSHVVAAAFKKIVTAKKNSFKKVEILGDGSPKREFTYSIDVSDWIISILDKIQDLPDVLNLSSGEEYSVSDYYIMIAEALDYSCTFEYNLNFPNGVRSKLMDSTNAIKNFGWNPTTKFKSGIKVVCEQSLFDLGIND